MAQVKKKSTKKAVKKNVSNSSKSSDLKKVETKKNVKKKATDNVDNIKENNVKKTKVLKNDSPKNYWKIGSLVLSVLVVLLIIGIVFVYFSNSKSVNVNNNLSNISSNDLNQTNNQLSSIKLVVVEDPNCKTCSIDFFAGQLKNNIESNLEVEKVDFNSKKGQDLIKKTNSKELPIVMFSKNVIQEEKLKQLSQIFQMITFNEQDYYLAPSQIVSQMVANKVLINPLEIKDAGVVIGNKEAPVTIYEFTDFECPYCAIAEGNEKLVEQFKTNNPNYKPGIKGVYDNYIDKGLVKIVFFNYPVVHPSAKIVHVAAMCANEQNKFREYADKLWSSREEWTALTSREDILKTYAKDLNLDSGLFDDCLDNQKTLDLVEKDIKIGQELSISGTPSFFIEKNIVSGAQDFEVFKSIIDAKIQE